MSEDSPLEDLSEQLEALQDDDGDAIGDDGTADGAIDDGDDGGRATGENGTGLDVTAAAPEPADGDPTEPAFPTSATRRGPIFPREGTWDAYDEAITRIEDLLEEHGVEDLAGREFDDAILRLAADNPEAVATIVLRARGIEVDGE